MAWLTRHSPTWPGFLFLGEKKRQYRTKEGSYIVRRPKNVRNMNHEGGNSHAESPELCFFPGKPTSLQILKAPFYGGHADVTLYHAARLNTWFLPVSSFFVHLSSHEAMPMAAENETLKPCSFCTLHFLLAGALKSRDRVQLWLGGRGLADVGKALCSTPQSPEG